MAENKIVSIEAMIGLLDNRWDKKFSDCLRRAILNDLESSEQYLDLLKKYKKYYDEYEEDYDSIIDEAGFISHMVDYIQDKFSEEQAEYFRGVLLDNPDKLNLYIALFPKRNKIWSIGDWNERVADIINDAYRKANLIDYRTSIKLGFDFLVSLSSKPIPSKEERDVIYDGFWDKLEQKDL